MSSVDTRVVEMKFDNNAFAKGVADTMSALDRLKSSLKMDGASEGLSQAQSGLDNLGEKTGLLGGKFSALQTVAIGALLSIGAKAAEVGKNVVSSLTIDPVMDGFREYETNMNSIQTILSNTRAAGTSLDQVEAALQKLNEYSDQTIYNFSDMAQNIGRFTAAGVGLDDSVNAIKGIANLAAISGTNSTRAAGAMQQLSQAISSGTVSLEDWNSVETAGMGGTVFQRALAETAVAMGKINSSALQLEGPMKTVSINGESFRKSISTAGGKASWLTSDVLTATLAQFTGDLSDAELAAQGFNDAQISAIQSQAAAAVNAAQDVRTLSALMDTLKEGVGSGWAQTWKIVFGGFNEAKDLFTGLSNSIGGFFQSQAQARNEMLQGWKDQGGRDALIEGLKNAAMALLKVVGPIRDAFRDIFPPMTSERLVAITNAFRDFTAKLIPTPETMNKIARTFDGLFSVIKIGVNFVKAFASFLFDLIGHVAQGSGSVLNFTATIGDFLTWLNFAIERGDYFNKFFDVLGKVVKAPIDGIKLLIGWIGQLIGGLASSSGTSAIIDKIRAAFEKLSGAGDMLDRFGQVVNAVFSAIGDVVQPVLDKISSAIQTAWDAIGGFVSSLTVGDLVGAAGAGGLVGLVLVIRNGINSLLDLFKKGEDSGPGFFDTIKETLGQLTDTLSAMQNTLRAATLLQIAAAVGILTISMVALSKIDAAGLTRATVAITGMIVNLTAGMVLLDKLMGNSKAVKLGILAVGMLLLATAVDVLASAATKLADLDWNQLAKGLTGVVVLLGAIAGAMQLMPNEKKMLSSAAGMILIAEAVKILVSAVEDMAGLSWGEIAKGLAGTAALLTSLALYTKFARMSSIGDGLGILLLAAAIKVLASAMKDIADLSWNEIAKGLTGIAGGLIAMAGAMRLLPKDQLVGDGLALLIVAAGLKVMASAMTDIAALDWNELVKGLVGLGGGLILIAAALRMMPESTLASAASLLIVSVALKILASAMTDMGSMSWEEIAKSLIVLAGALLIIVVALNAMDAALPGAAALAVAALGLKALANAMVIMGGMSWSDIAAALVALAGALLVLAVGLTAMLIALPGALALLAAVPALTGLALVMQLFGNMSWGDIGQAIVGMTAMFAVLAIGGALSPLIGLLAISLTVLGGALLALGAGVYLAGAGIDLLATGLQNLVAVGTPAIDALKNAIQVIIDKIPEFLGAIADGIIAFAQKIADGAPAFGAAAAAILDQLILVFTQKLPQLVEALLNGIEQLLTSLQNHMPSFVEKGANLVISLLNGLASKIGGMVTAATNLIVSFLNGLSQNLPRIIQAGIDLVISFVNGLADGIRNNQGRMTEAAGNLGRAIIDGVKNALTAGVSAVVNAVKGMAQSALDGAKSLLGIKSPSREFMKVGQYSAEGMAIGIEQYSHLASDASSQAGSDIVSAMGKSIAGLSDLISTDMDMTPVITPVLDLSAVQRDSSQLGDLLGAAPLTVSSAYSRAADTAATLDANQVVAQLAAAESTRSVTFVQNNTSPKALSSAEIYRNTNNQISRAKGVLTNAN